MPPFVEFRPVGVFGTEVLEKIKFSGIDDGDVEGESAGRLREGDRRVVRDPDDLPDREGQTQSDLHVVQRDGRQFFLMIDEAQQMFTGVVPCEEGQFRGAGQIAPRRSLPGAE